MCRKLPFCLELFAEEFEELSGPSTCNDCAGDELLELEQTLQQRGDWFGTEPKIRIYLSYAEMGQMLYYLLTPPENAIYQKGQYRLRRAFMRSLSRAGISLRPKS